MGEHPADIIAEAIRMFHRTEGAGRCAEIAIAKLSAAGYRFLAPGELDGETLERAAAVVATERMKCREEARQAEANGDQRVMLEYMAGGGTCILIASAIRALRESGG